MGRSIITKKYEITPEIKELQKLAVNAQKSSGCEVNVDITQDLVTINGFRKMNRVEAKSYLLDLLDPNNPNKKITTSTVRNVELEEKLAKEAAKKAVDENYSFYYCFDFGKSFHFWTEFHQ